MDPYLEFYWRDVHQALAIYARDALNQVLPEQLRCLAQERVYIATDESARQTRYPDVYVVEHSGDIGTTGTIAGAAVAEPILVHLHPEPVSETFLEIVDGGSSGRVITVIEFLSPTNKLPGDGRDDYRRKQAECRKALVNLVEIDLTREGNREEVLPSSRPIGADRRATYHACVWRAGNPGISAVYSMPLSAPLSGISIPLRPSDVDAVLDLQSLVERAYANGRYRRFIDYRRALDSPLAPDDQAWAAKLLASAVD
jgi:hypothetical protein